MIMAANLRYSSQASSSMPRLEYRSLICRWTQAMSTCPWPTSDQDLAVSRTLRTSVPYRTLGLTSIVSLLHHRGRGVPGVDHGCPGSHIIPRPATIHMDRLIDPGGDKPLTSGSPSNLVPPALTVAVDLSQELPEPVA